MAAALLVEQGYRVVGVFMRQYDYADVRTKNNDFLACAQEEDRLSALAVAKHLAIPFFSWDFRKVYHEKVVDYLFREYARGRTPNPDIMCNVHLKFGAFLKRARKEGADYIATGHYAKTAVSVKRLAIRNRILNVKRYTLKTARDSAKDQTYFLSQLTQSKLRHCVFPIGEYQKSEVREMAKKFGLATANRKDSQGICFVGDVSMQDFLSSRIPSKPGDVITTKGICIGTHKGAAYYTIGQRHGLGLKGGENPYYVSAIDIKRNILIVTQGEKKADLFSKQLTVKNLHWISGITPPFPFSCSARIRYRQPLEVCSVQRAVFKNNEHYNVVFKWAQRAVAPGQFVVFYKGKECLGGGIIYK